MNRSWLLLFSLIPTFASAQPILPNPPAWECEMSEPVALVLEGVDTKTPSFSAISEPELVNLKNTVSLSDCDRLHVYAILSAKHAENEKFIEALDIIEEFISMSGESKTPYWLLFTGRIKFIAESSDKDFSRAENRRLKQSPEEIQAIAMFLYESGEFKFPNEKGGFGGAILNTLSAVSTSYDEVRRAEELIEQRDWDALVNFVIKERMSSGKDIDYFYLAMASFGQGKLSNARKYANESEYASLIGSRNCTSYGYTDSYRETNLCGGRNLDVELERLRTAMTEYEAAEARAQEESQRIAQEEEARRLAELQSAEMQRERENTARQAVENRRNALLSRYPSDWVSSIMENNVIMGMSKESVIESWGEPEKMESLGEQTLWHFPNARVVFTQDSVTFIDSF